jgi:acyl carrier protein
MHSQVEDGGAGTVDVRSGVRSLVSEILCMEVGEIDDRQLLSECGMTSLDLIDVVVKLEKRFSIQFDPATMSNLSVNVLVKNIESLLRPS